MTEPQREHLFESLGECAKLTRGDRLDTYPDTCGVKVSYRGWLGSTWRKTWSESGEKALVCLKVLARRTQRYLATTRYVEPTEKNIVSWAAIGVRLLADEYVGYKPRVARGLREVADAIRDLYNRYFPQRSPKPRPIDMEVPSVGARDAMEMARIMSQFTEW